MPQTSEAPKTPGPPTCSTCPCFEPDMQQCRKGRPRWRNGDAFPTTYANWWCGEHPDFPAYLRSLGRGAGDDVMPAIDEAEAWLRRRFRECRHWPVDSLMELARALFPEPVVRMARTRLPLVYRNFDVSWGGGEAP